MYNVVKCSLQGRMEDAEPASADCSLGAAPALKASPTWRWWLWPWWRWWWWWSLLWCWKRWHWYQLLLMLMAMMVMCQRPRAVWHGITFWHNQPPTTERGKLTSPFLGAIFFGKFCHMLTEKIDKSLKKNFFSSNQPEKGLLKTSSWTWRSIFLCEILSYFAKKMYFGDNYPTQWSWHSGLKWGVRWGGVPNLALY